MKVMVWKEMRNQQHTFMKTVLLVEISLVFADSGCGYCGGLDLVALFKSSPIGPNNSTYCI